MPILVDVVQGVRAPFIVVPPDTRRLEFESVDGRQLITWDGDEWISRAGITGIDVPPREVIREKVPGLPGSRLQEIRDEERVVFLPVSMRPSDRDWRTHLAQMATVRGFMDYRSADYVADEGTFDLVAYGDGSRRSLRCTYLEGLEGDYDAGSQFSWWRMVGVRLLAVDPYWHGDAWSTPEVALPKPAPFLSNSLADAFPRAISPSVALGAGMPVSVGGDVPSAAVIDGTGPWTSLHITSPQGLDVTIGAVAAGHSFHLDTGRNLECLHNGASDWSLVGDSPQWRPLPPGDASISIEVTGADDTTRARVSGVSLWETAW
ncbi:MAG: hypothetical protein ACTHQ3_15755 [Motilibacteraceae bacterium]